MCNFISTEITKLKEELDFLYKKSRTQNQIHLEEEVIEALFKTLCNIIPIDKKTTVNEIAKEVKGLNNILNKHSLCTTNLVSKDYFLDYYIDKADWLECEELKRQLVIEKAR